MTFPRIFGYTAADLQNMGMTRFLLQAEPLNSSPASRTQEPASESLTPLCELRAEVSSHRDPDASGVKPSQPRSKIARLPADIQTNLNTLLARGCPYADIIRYLNTQGHPGFNKVNLHAWKKTGFQDWLHSAGQATSSETDHAVLEAGG